MRTPSRLVIIFLKLYVAGALVAAAILSPVALSFVPAALLIWYLVEWRWRFPGLTDVMTQLFMFHALALLFVTALGPWLSLAAILPVLPILNRALEDSSKTMVFNPGKYSRRLTATMLTLVVLLSVTLVVALLLGSVILMLADAVAAFYLGIIAIYSWRHFSVKPVIYEQSQFRCLAGKTESMQIILTLTARTGGTLFLKSPYDWLSIKPRVLSFSEPKWPIKITITPPLSGPALLKLEGYAVDRWGLIQTNFQLEPVNLLVIPRARYAAWLARKYLSNSGGGNLSVISNITSVKTLFGLRSGVEYYGNQQYQPGDSMKNIDWKHSIKFNKLVSKEFTESHTRPAILLANLTAGDASGADKLAYDLIVTAISLAREGVTTSLASYNNEGVVESSPPLHEAELVLRSLQTIKKINIIPDPAQYLKPPDVMRLRMNLSQLRKSGGGPSAILAELLQFEYTSLSNNAKSHPSTLALAEAKAKTTQQCSVLSVSQRNHDAEALEFNSYILAKNGSAIIEIKAPL